MKKIKLILALLAVSFLSGMTSPGLGFIAWKAPTNHEFVVLGEHRADGAVLDQSKITGFNMYKNGKFFYKQPPWARSSLIREHGCYTLTTILDGRESTKHSKERCY